jgi:hypothetical protein
MFLQTEILQSFQQAAQSADQAITIQIAAKNAGIAAIVAFTTLYLTAYKRVGANDFVFIDWLYANRNRWLNGVITLTLFSVLSVLVPAIGAVANLFGFNLNADIPLSLGLAIAAWLASTTKAAPPKEADQGDVTEDADEK